MPSHSHDSVEDGPRGSDSIDKMEVPLERTEVKRRGLPLASLTFQTLGIVYSELGTSPLYVLNGIWDANDPVPSKQDIIGGVSAVIWAVTLLPLLKYAFIALKFATREGKLEGEGGTFALYQGMYPRSTAQAVEECPGDKKKAVKERLRWPLLIWAIFGTSLTLADGIFTPAVSVTAAVSGIGVANPQVLNTLKPISIAIIIVFFVWQRFGTAKLGVVYGPVALLWFILLSITGIWNITTYPGIFRAFDPSRAIMFFIRTGKFDNLAGVLLAITGCEAIFACVGHFNILSVQLSFVLFVYPALILSYLGQGASLIIQGEPVTDNIFYQTIPGPGAVFWIVFAMAILSAIIASQCIVSATFSIIQQLISRNCFLPLRIHHTSSTFQGQIYVPAANWSLMIAIIIVIAAFPDRETMLSAYGFAAATVMFATSVVLAIQMNLVKCWPVIVGIAYFLTFGFLDALFWAASFQKVPYGGWVPLMIGVVLSLGMILWSWGKASRSKRIRKVDLLLTPSLSVIQSLEEQFDGQNVLELPGFAVEHDRALARLAEELTFVDNAVGEHYEFYVPQDQAANNAAPPAEIGLTRVRARAQRDPNIDNRELMRIPTCAVFHRYVAGQKFPHAFSSFVRQWPGVPQVLIFLSVNVLPSPSVPEHQRYVISKLGSMEGFYFVRYQIGFREPFDLTVDTLLPALYTFEREHDPQFGEVAVERIKSVSVSFTHIVPKYKLRSKNIYGPSRGGFILNEIRRFLIEDLYERLSIMFPETINWRTTPDQLVQVGITAVV